MSVKQPFFLLLCRIGLISGSLLLSVADAADTTYKIPLKRLNPSEPISRDGILSAVKSKYTGRILSVQEKPSTSAPDCHIVRMLSLNGEYMIIKVAC